jgi:hypothetical protein
MICPRRLAVNGQLPAHLQLTAKHRGVCYNPRIEICTPMSVQIIQMGRTDDNRCRVQFRFRGLFFSAGGPWRNRRVSFRW